jgi:hypothetical protein
MPALELLRLAIYYYDKHTKCPVWGYDDFLRDTARLVFSPALVRQAEQERFEGQRFKKFRRKGWQSNPCFVRYREDGAGPDFYCERGKEGRKDDASTERGHPQSIEFHFDDGTIYHFNNTWMKDTVELVFQHDRSRGPEGLSINRISASNVEIILDVPGTGIPGRMPESRGISDFSCAYNGGSTRLSLA